MDSFFDIDIREEAHATQFLCYGSDPQCQLGLKKNILRGWYCLAYCAEIINGKIRNTKIYFDTGEGFNENESVILSFRNAASNEHIIYFPRKVLKIRFDPTENGCVSFMMSELSLKRISKLELFRRLPSEPFTWTTVPKNIKHRLKIFFNILFNDAVSIEALLVNNLKRNDPFNYQHWINEYDTYTSDELMVLEQKQEEFAYRPLISVVLPTFNTPDLWLHSCINSVINQVYDNWELCISDDCSTINSVKEIISTYVQRDKRIKVVFRELNGHIATSSNSALSLATGEFVAFLDHDDELSPLSLYRIVESLNTDATTDFFYSDEDKIDKEGRRSLPFFKPDWSPALFFSQNYITHLACIRRTIVKDINGFTPESQGSQDYDLFLKAIFAGAKVKHLPFILYHWRLHEASTSMISDSKPYAHIAGRNAVGWYLTNKYPDHFSSVEDGEYTFTYLPRFKLSSHTKVSIIIPTKDKVVYLEPCINSIISKSTWKNYEIIILNNNSVENETFSFFREIVSNHSNIKVVDANFEFNWSKLNNTGYRYSEGEYLIFLNNDISVITPDWMERICEYASLPDVGTVGATLLYEDGTIQHAGVVVGMNEWADHIFKGMHPSHFPSPYVSNSIPRNVLAVTGACVAIKRSRFEELGLFDESFIICGSDVELGIRSYQKGYFNVVNSPVKLLHYESKSRGSFVPENDFIQSSLKYEPYRTQSTDPFFNSNLSIYDTTPTCKA